MLAPPGPEDPAGRAAARYEEIAYPGAAYPETHPDRLATVAVLSGMRPAPPERCRVLELGCGDGGNLIPIAFGLPESRSTGVDLCGSSIRKGRAMAAALGLGNIALHELDLREISPSFGQFDYIIAHGLYSWAPAVVREKVLAIAAANLAPQGVAYVSYNTYPGGHLRRMVREMMLFHIGGLPEPQQQVEQARALLRMLADARAPGEAYREFLSSEVDRLCGGVPAILYHDELAPVYQPCYFHEFIAQAGRHGLEYLAEANFTDLRIPPLPAAASELLDRLGDDFVRKEQYLDFFRCRCFRRTLLCHREVALDREIKPERLRELAVASPLRPVAAEPDLSAGAVQEFRGPTGLSATTAHPLTKAALWELGRVWPEALPFPELLERLAVPDAALSEMLLQACAAGPVELHVSPPRLAARAGERPVSSPLARLQAREQDVVTTLRHTMVRLEGERERQLLLLLDGSRDRAALLNELAAPVPPEQLEENLAKLARLGLLVG
ncbi:MAG: class I SAM-dependent methyltransferase [Acidobacteriota bacterium]